MAKQKLSLLSFLLFVLAIQFSFGQAAPKSSMADSINNRFRSLISASNNYQQYKVVKATKLESLRKTTHAEVSDLEESISGLNDKLAHQKAQLNEMKQALADSDTQLDAAIAAKDQLSFLGIPT